jgi:hypothetical protein
MKNSRNATIDSCNHDVESCFHATFPFSNDVDPRNHNQNGEIIMSTKNINTHRATVTLALPRTNPALIVYAQNIVKRVLGNAFFPSPTPTPAEITTAIDDLQVAEAAVLTRVKGAVAVRNQKRAALVVLLQELRGYIQKVADADPTNAAAIIESAGFAVRKTAARKPRTFVAKAGPVSGTAELNAVFAGQRSSYEWQYSTDGGKTWIVAPVTIQAKTTIAGLVPGATVQFRYRPVTRTGEGNWSEPVSLIVH